MSFRYGISGYTNFNFRERFEMLVLRVADNKTVASNFAKYFVHFYATNNKGLLNGFPCRIA